MVCVNPLQHLMKLESMIPNMYSIYNMYISNNIHIIFNLYIPNSQVVLIAHLKDRSDIILSTSNYSTILCIMASQSNVKNVLHPPNYLHSNRISCTIQHITYNPRIYFFTSCNFSNQILYLKSSTIPMFTSFNHTKSHRKQVHQIHVCDGHP